MHFQRSKATQANNFKSPPKVSEENAESKRSKVNEPKKKRVRRAKLELEFLRHESKKLENELAQLQNIQGQRCLGLAFSKKPKRQATRTAQGYYLLAPRKPVQRSVWQEIAERQMKERSRALTLNSELRAQLEAEHKLGTQLMLLLERQTSMKVIEHTGRRRKNNIVGDDVFKDLLRLAEDTLLEVRMMIRSAVFQDPNSSFVDTFMETLDNDDEAFIMQANATLPFGVQATSKALWKVLGSDGIKDQCYFHQVVQRSDTVVVQAFGIHFTTDIADADFRCKYTFSRFEDANAIVLVWVGCIDPIEVNGVQFSGVQCQTRGWIHLSEHKSVNAYGTLVRSRSRLWLEKCNDDLTDIPQLRSLLNLAQPTHDKFVAAYYPFLEKALIEEDWKINGECGDIEEASDHPTRPC